MDVSLKSCYSNSGAFCDKRSLAERILLSLKSYGFGRANPYKSAMLTQDSRHPEAVLLSIQVSAEKTGTIFAASWGRKNCARWTLRVLRIAGGYASEIRPN